jgi:predicted dienelactone hydrolase
MKHLTVLVIFSYVIFISFPLLAQGQQAVDSLPFSSNVSAIKVERLALYDETRNRSIPVALYIPDTFSLKQKLVVFNHVYGENKGTPYLDYSYLNGFLAQHGYLVISIQHELPEDDLLPTKGDLRETRRPNWESAVQNILFVVKELKARQPNLDDIPKKNQ